MEVVRKSDFLTSQNFSMRVEAHDVGSVMHLMKRGARGNLIVQDEADKENFLKSLFYLNDEHQDENWRKAVKHTSFLEHPSYWPKPSPLVDIWAWTLMPNHFHLIVREKTSGGVAKFMQRLCGSMSAYMNAKYSEKGSLFQGGYRGRVVNDDADLRWLASYVMVKNTLELAPDGLTGALRHFEQSWKWGSAYPFSSMGLYAQNISSPIISEDENILRMFWKQLKSFKDDSRDMLESYITKLIPTDCESLLLE